MLYQDWTWHDDREASKSEWGKVWLSDLSGLVWTLEVMTEKISFRDNFHMGTLKITGTEGGNLTASITLDGAD